MKQIFTIFTILLCIPFIAFSQNNFSPAEITAKIKQIKADYQAQKITQQALLRNSTYRADSVVFFNNYTLLDSVNYAKSNFTYLEDSVFINESQFRNQSTGQLENDARLLVKFDEAGRQTLFKYSVYSNGVLIPFFEVQYFFRSASGDQLDSVKNYVQDFNTDEFYLFEFEGDYAYDNSGNLLSHTTVQLEGGVSVVEIRKDVNTYLPDNRLDTVYYYTGSTQQPLELEAFDALTYSGDTVQTAKYVYDTGTLTWSLNYLNIQTVTPNNLVLSNFDYFRNPATNNLEINQQYTITYDGNENVVTRTVISYGNNGTFGGNHDVITYNSFGDESAVYSYNIDTNTGEVADLNYKGYYYYSEISSTSDQTSGIASLEISPNPATDAVYIRTDADAIHHIELINTSGQVVRQIHLNGVPFVKLDRNELAGGMYLLKITADSGTAAKLICFE